MFQNAGYRGLYNMNISELRARKNVPAKRSPLDFMGKTELAANLFRITQTDEKIKNERIVGQDACEDAAQTAGYEVRQAIKRMGGKMPEQLPPVKDIKAVHKQIKTTQRDFKKIDKSSPAARALPEPTKQSEPESD